MLKKEWHARICGQYRTKKCKGCPLMLADNDACMANMTYDEQEHKWMPDKEHKDGTS